MSQVDDDMVAKAFAELQHQTARLIRPAGAVAAIIKARRRRTRRISVLGVAALALAAPSVAYGVAGLHAGSGATAIPVSSATHPPLTQPAQIGRAHV